MHSLGQISLDVFLSLKIFIFANSEDTDEMLLYLSGLKVISGVAFLY